MSVSECSHHVVGNGVNTSPSPNGKCHSLHRLREVRQQQGISLRRIARHLKVDIREARIQEEESHDLPLSTLYAWQKILDVPVSDLLVEADSSLSPPILERARMVKVMKTAAAILEKSEVLPIRRMAQMLVDQLLEIMPELEGVSPWHAVGQRRTLDELGRAFDRRITDPTCYRYS